LQFGFWLFLIIKSSLLLHNNTQSINTPVSIPSQISFTSKTNQHQVYEHGVIFFVFMLPSVLELKKILNITLSIVTITHLQNFQPSVEFHHGIDHWKRKQKRKQNDSRKWWNLRANYLKTTANKYKESVTLQLPE